jgi:hypothetical protein
MKKILLSVLLILLVSAAQAEVRFKDLPADHWASKYVYDLVKMGITSGYPDGTFRGNKSITRYETAIFLSKLAQKLGGEDMSQVKADLNAIKSEISTLKKNSSGGKINGIFEMDSYLANVLANQGRVVGNGPLVNYRLITALSREFNEGTALKVNLDTMDAGYNGGTRDLAKQMVDFEGKVRVNPADMGVLGDVMTAPLDIKVTAGPGKVQHIDTTGLLSSETDTWYNRPDTGISLATRMWGWEVTGGYQVKGFNASNSGKVDTNYLFVSGGYDFPKFPIINNLKLLGTGATYIKNPHASGPKDYRLNINLASQINPKFLASGILAIAKREASGWMVKGQLDVSDFMVNGGRFMLRGTKVGSQYLTDGLLTEDIGESGFDVFNRPLYNSTVNIDAEFRHPLAEKIALLGKGALRLSGDMGYGADRPLSRLTGELGMAFSLAADSILNLTYRAEQDPTISETTDFAQLGLNYSF